MNRTLYSITLYLAMPAILLRLLFRSLRAPAYRRRIAERFGYVSRSVVQAQSNGRGTTSIWLHCVSVGETLAAAPLVKRLRTQWPDSRLILTTMTPTGSERVIALFGTSVIHSYLPYDTPGAIKRFLRTLRPDLLIIMETELWPNTIHYCRRKGVKIALANGRLSPKSAASYQRIARMTADMLAKLDLVAVQAEADANRFIALGAHPDKIRITGSLKFDVSLDAPDERTIDSFFAHIAASDRPVLVAASTRDGEEEKVLAAFMACLASVNDLLLILVPRHPERFDRIATLCRHKGLELARRSHGDDVAANTQVVLGDSMGEMLDYLQVADIAFVGGSLVSTGCHNVLEPAALGVPVLVGPSQFNFATICDQLADAGALQTVADERELAEVILVLLHDRERAKAMGRAGRQLVERNRGSLDALVTELVPLLD
ncbi:MAG: lipid IV(A) 3-deoxy-D-manno-octulosonic acid transferase [Pseudohongiellaceae bacterium]